MLPWVTTKALARYRTITTIRAVGLLRPSSSSSKYRRMPHAATTMTASRHTRTVAHGASPMACRA